MVQRKMESWKARRASRSKGNALCKKHPKHRQSPGVCSICLNQKLSHLSNSFSSRAARSPSSSSSSSSSSSLSSYLSSLSSSSASSYSSPVVDYRRRSGVFNKSRSMAFVSKKIIKGGFWSKLMHSRTTRERVVAPLH